MLNEKEHKQTTPEKQEKYDREFDWDNSIGYSKVNDMHMMHAEVDKIGWDGVRKRLARETGQDINKGMNYHPPQSDSEHLHNEPKLRT